MSDEANYLKAYNRDRIVHIVDTDANNCQELSTLFRVEGFLTTYSLEAAHFVTSLERIRPDVAIINLELGDESGLTVLQKFRQTRSGSPVMMVANVPSHDATVQAMKLGAVDVMVKPWSHERMLQSVRDVLRRDIHLGDYVGGYRKVVIRGFTSLTPREREVLELITNGSSNKETGRELEISPRTVEVHRARVMVKLGAKNTADLMRIVMSS